MVDGEGIEPPSVPCKGTSFPLAYPPIFLSHAPILSSNQGRHTIELKYFVQQQTCGASYRFLLFTLFCIVSVSAELLAVFHFFSIARVCELCQHPCYLFYFYSVVKYL